MEFHRLGIACWPYIAKKVLCDVNVLKYCPQGYVVVVARQWKKLSPANIYTNQASICYIVGMLPMVYILAIARIIKAHL